MDALAAHDTINKQALESEKNLWRIKNILLGLGNLWELSQKISLFWIWNLEGLIHFQNYSMNRLELISYQIHTAIWTWYLEARGISRTIIFLPSSAKDKNWSECTSIIEIKSTI